VGQYLAHHEGVMGGEVSLPRASRSAGSLERRRPRANSASTSGSVVPLTSASSIALPEAPSTLVATQESLMAASWSTFFRGVGFPSCALRSAPCDSG
jgi:hypothetical protein